MTTLRGDLATLSIWDDWACDGGANVAELALIVGAVERWDVDTGWSCSVELSPEDPRIASVVKRQILRWDLRDGTVREYRISSVSDARDVSATTVTVEGQDPRIDLAERVLLSTTGSAGVVYFDDGRAELPPDDYIDDVIVPGAVAAGLSVSKGTITPTVDLSLTWSKSSALSLLQQVVQGVRDRGIACEFDFRRNGTTDYKIDLVTAIGSSATAPELHVGRHVTRWQRRKTTTDQASRVFPFGDSDGTGYPATIAHAAWAVSAKTGDVLTLIDPLGGAGPVQFTSQHADPNGVWYLRATDGTLTQVQASSRTSATQSSVTVDTGDGSLFTVGDEVEFRADATGTLLASLTHPTYIAAPPTGYGEKIVPLERPALRGERNLLPNPWCETWPTPTSPPTGWGVTTINPSHGATTTITREVVAGGLVQFGSYALRVTWGSAAVGGVLVTLPSAPVEPIAGADLFTISLSMQHMLPAVASLVINVIPTPALPAGTLPLKYYVPAASIPLDVRWDLTIAGVQLPAGTTSVSVTVQMLGTFDFLIDAAQITQTPVAADAFFVGPRANALWQAANEYLGDFGDPPAEFQGNLLDYARIDPTTWAAVAVVPGVSTRVVDDDRSLDLTVRAVRIEWNRLVAGDTRVNWSTRPRSFIASASGNGARQVQPGPAPVTPGSPALNPPVTPVTPVTTSEPGTLLVPFYARGDADVTLTNLPASATERTARNEAWVWLYPYQWVRLEAHVVTAASQGQLVAKYSVDDGATWDFLDDTSGPVLDLTSTGTVRGDDVAIAAAALTDVIVALFESGGNGTDDPVVGSVFLHCHSGVQLVNPPAQCPIPGGIQYEGDLGSYTDLGDLYTTRGDDADLTGLFSIWYGSHTADAQTDLDAGRPFNGAPALMGYYEAAGSYHGSGFLTALSGYDDVTHFMVFEIESGMDNTETARQLGLQILDWTTDNPGAAGYNSAGIFLRSGRVYFDWYRSASGWDTAVDLGAVANWTGAKLQLVMRIDRTSATDFQVSIYLDTPCTTPSTPLYQGTHTAAQATNQWISIDHWNDTFSPMPTPGKHVWMWQVGYDTNPTTYGL